MLSFFVAHHCQKLRWTESLFTWILCVIQKFMVKDEKLRDKELLWNRVQIDWLIDWLIDLNSERLLKLLIQDFFLNWVILLKLFREISSSDIPQRIFTEREITVTWMQLNLQITQSFFLGIVVKKTWISWRLCVVIKKVYMEIRQRTRVQVWWALRHEGNAIIYYHLRVKWVGKYSYRNTISLIQNLPSFPHIACVQQLSSPNGASLNSPNLSSSDVTPVSSSSTGMKGKSWQTDVTSSTSSDKTYTLKGTRLIVLYNFEGKAFDDLPVRPGEYVYANLKDQIVPGYIWAYSPNSKKSGFIPDDHVKEPVITDI